VTRKPSEAPRRRSRDLALQVLYASDLDARNEVSWEQRVEEQLGRVEEHFEFPSGAREFGEVLARGVARHCAALDQKIEGYALHWRVDRMNVIDRNVLRLAVFELLHTQTPAPVIIDEAVELARRFGIDPSPGFVNGVLDALARDLPVASE